MPTPKGGTSPRRSLGKILPLPGGPGAPKHRAKPPESPAHLSESAAEVWRELLTEPALVEVVTSADRWMLEIVSTKLLARRRLDAAIEKRGGDMTYTCTTEGGSAMERPYPEQAMIDAIDRQLAGLLGRFGLSPADRSRVATTHGSAPAEASPEDEFIPRPKR